MKIGHINGTFWNAENNCFGPIEAATEFVNTDEIPDHITDNNGTVLEKYIFLTTPTIDIQFYATGDDHEALASVKSKMGG